MGGSRSDLFAIVNARITDLLGSSGVGDEYFLEYANADPAVQGKFTADLPVIRNGLAVKPKGKTALIDALCQVSAMRKARRPNRALLIVSDGFDNKSVRKLDDLKSAYSQVACPIFFIVLIEKWRAEPQSSDAVRDREDLIQFVNQTGGYSVVVGSEQEILAATTHLDLAMRAPYVLLFPSPPPSRRPLDVRVEVKDERPSPLVLYREVQIPR